MSRINPTRTLQNAKYSFDASRNAWFCGKKPIEEEEVLICLNPVCKIPTHQRCWWWGEHELERLKRSPETILNILIQSGSKYNMNMKND